MTRARDWGCGRPECSVSTGIHEGVTFGSGMLDPYGFWEKPCRECAVAWEKMYPHEAPCWPPDHFDVEKHLQQQAEEQEFWKKSYPFLYGDYNDPGHF